MRSGSVLVFDGLDERVPARGGVEGGSEAPHDRAGGIGGHAVWDAAAQRAAEVPVADAHVRRPVVVVGESVRYAEPCRVVHAADHYLRPAAERTAEALERGGVLHRAGLEPPDSQRLERPPCGCRVAPDRADHMEALTAAGAAPDPQLGAVD